MCKILEVVSVKTFFNSREARRGWHARSDGDDKQCELLLILIRHWRVKSGGVDMDNPSAPSSELPSPLLVGRIMWPALLGGRPWAEPERMSAECIGGSWLIL